MENSIAPIPVLRFCADQNFWYPFTFVRDGHVIGVHIDVIALALKNLGYRMEVVALPWIRCLREAELGMVDGVATASWAPDRELYLSYPEDAAAEQSNYAVAHVSYVVVVLAESNYEFDGNLASLPQPVRAPRGYSIVDDMRRAGVEVDADAPADDNNLMKLLRDRKGAVVTTPDVLPALLRRREFTGHFRISGEPITSKDYFLGFSRQGNVSDQDAEEIWHEIARIRENHELMKSISVRY